VAFAKLGLYLVVRYSTDKRDVRVNAELFGKLLEFGKSGPVTGDAAAARNTELLSEYANHANNFHTV
jgi:hypothetical protein